MSVHALYLHGFASSPLSAKGRALGERLRGQVASFAIPNLEGDDFTALTMDGMIKRVRAAIAALPEDGGPVLLIGSSLGGYLATLVVAKGLAPRTGALLLIAPAFGFTQRWAEQLGAAGIADWRDSGSRLFFHHGAERELPLGYAFYESCVALPPWPGPVERPTAIVHGRGDTTVDWRASLRFVECHPAAELHLVQGDHRLTERRHEDLIAGCARDMIARITV